MTLNPRLKSTLYSITGAMLTAAGVALVQKLVALPELAAFAPYILAVGTTLLGKEHLLPERAK
jgi:hypothetical protein